MEKQKRWQIYLIFGVILLTVYNILPTLFYYAKPLHRPIGEKEAFRVASEMVERVNGLEDEALTWLEAQSKNLSLKPLSIAYEPHDPSLIKMEFKTAEEAAFFGRTLQRAGSLIPFVPAQLAPIFLGKEEGSSTLYVQRRVGVHIDPKQVSHYFRFAAKKEADGRPSPLYQELVADRLATLALHFDASSRLDPEALQRGEGALRLARSIVAYENTFGDGSPITARYFAGLNQSATALTALFEKESSEVASRIEPLKERSEGTFLSSDEMQRLEILEEQKSILGAAASIVKRNQTAFETMATPLTREQIVAQLNSQPYTPLQTVSLGERNPFIAALAVDWNHDALEITLHPEVVALQNPSISSEEAVVKAEKVNQLLFQELAQATHLSNEKILPSHQHFIVELSDLTGSSSLLALDLRAVAQLELQTLQHLVQTAWQGRGELSKEAYPFYTYEQFQKLPVHEKGLGWLLYAPLLDSAAPTGFRSGSVYLIGKGLPALFQKYRALQGKEREIFESDLQALNQLLRQNGFIGYYGNESSLPAEFKNDFIYELSDTTSYLLAATREEFSLKGSRRFAHLDFTDVEQRILALNKIETAAHEDLLKWQDEYTAAHVNLNPQARYDVPKPTKSVFLNNLQLSARKYFRGDERKVLKWGLDLSGGKTVRIGLRDRNHQPITEEADLREAVSELYRRVNRLGVSEVTIRVEGSTIVLDFPGSQGLSASELIEASMMSFHVVNEKFTAGNPQLKEAVDRFLEDVWNEAVITNRKESESINLIAWQHLGGSVEHPEEFHPLTPHAKLLYDNGLRLAGPKSSRSSAFNDTLSMVTQFRGGDFSEWQGQTYPLLIVFNNYALQGTDLDNVQTAYSASEGNALNFGVKGSSTTKEGERLHPREDFYNWTSQFAEDKIGGTSKEESSSGRGWRMAVILNGYVVSAPTLNTALRESARITGHFSQREVNALAADLKAGSLSFTPQILSEENISPDLGKEQRAQGVLASLIGIGLVVLAMCIVYRFGGVVASIAVLFNLIILWGVLQNLGAALTLPGIAGIILTVGMAVDANVLVFERIREEFAVTKRLAASIASGYRKAFSAIVDSNLTTIIAAIILLNFDAGPVKGFALTLIIGIVSSMFTALFMTRAFFTQWVRNPKHKVLPMLKLFQETTFNFLKRAKMAFLLTALVLALGLSFFIAERKTLFGMDFTGGYALSLSLKEQPEGHYRLRTERALIAAGIGAKDFQIQERGRPQDLRIQLGPILAAKSEAAALPEVALFPYQENREIVWLLETLERGGLQVDAHLLPELHLYWSQMSGQLSQAMRHEALIGLGLALLCILIYITFRFEFKYAMSATLALVHDLLITLGLIAILHRFIPTVQIDLQMIAAFLTIIGYSLNDTIIIFDRIREDMRLLRKSSFTEIINHALNATLSRTVMTSGTTLLVLLALVIFGGPSIFNFALVMTLGVAVGTLSSLFVASPLLLYFHQMETKKGKRIEEAG